MTIYVNKAAVGANNGSSWADACTCIQPAMSAAYSAGGGEVWVAAGVYDEERAGSGAIAFREGPPQDLYGGFSGSETMRDQRDFTRNVTVIDGSQSAAGQSANHVVEMQDCYNARLDGFTIKGGRAIANPSWGNYGGGLYIDGYSGYYHYVHNCTFVDNVAETNGGAIAVYAGSLSIHNCKFLNNTAGGAGGAVYLRTNIWHLPFEVFETIFKENSATNGGGAICVTGSPEGEFRNSVFSNRSRGSECIGKQFFG